MNVSSEGGKAYFQLPQYGVGKEGVMCVACDAIFYMPIWNLMLLSSKKLVLSLLMLCFLAFG